MMRPLQLLLLLLGLAAAADEDYTEVALKRMAFTSCVKAWRPGQADLWPQVENFDPQLWLWTGDAVYANGTALSYLAPAFEEQLRVPAYERFLAYAAERGVKVDGVWDDHDLGVNDGGAETPDIPARQELFLDFLGVSADSPRRARRGLYRSLAFGSGERRAKVIMLDVRSHRGHYVIPSVGAWFHWFPTIGKFMPVLAAGCRYLSQLRIPGLDLALVDFQSEAVSVLGEEQWAWLEAELRDSDARVHVIVSSTQVLTSNPVFEGWKHFPRERRRLLDLLERLEVPGVVLISGDVHHGEIARYPYAADAAAAGAGARVTAVEITASGSTHSLGTSKKTKKLYPPILASYDEHRVQPESFYTGLNFGTLEIQWPDGPGEPEVLLAVRGVHSGSPAVSAQIRAAAEGGGSEIISA